MWQKRPGNMVSMPTNFRAFRSYFQDQGPSIFQTDASKRERDLEKQVATLEQLLGKKELEIQLLKKYLDFYAPRAGSLPGMRERW